MNKNGKRSLFDVDEYETDRDKVKNIGEKASFKSLAKTALVGIVFGILVYFLLGLIYMDTLREYLYYILIAVPVIATYPLVRNIKYLLAMIIGLYSAGLIFNVIVWIIFLLTDRLFII